MPREQRQLRSQELRTHNHQGDALRLGMNWTEEDLSKPQVLVESAWGMGHPGTFHFEPLIAEVSHGVFEAGGKPGVFTGERHMRWRDSGNSWHELLPCFARCNRRHG